MDANLGFSAAILEMLVFSQPGYIELLPAWPHKLSKGAASGILCRGRITISDLYWDMCAKTISVEMISETAREIRLKLPGTIKSWDANSFDGPPTGYCHGSLFEVTLKEGVETWLSFVLE